VNVVGLDLSLTATGVAWPDGTTETITTTPRDTLPDRLRYIRASIVEHLRDLIFLGPTVAVVEDLPYTRNQAGAQLGMVHGIMRVALDDLRRQNVVAGIALVPPATLKKYATGRGNANKAELLGAAIRRLRYEGHDDNQVDAIWLRQMGLDHYAPGMAALMPVAHRDAARAVDWPRVEVPAP
jgi:Holliday junction resolvasome RuvABC endonuclease subunit